MSGTGFARCVKLDTLDEFDAYLAQPPRTTGATRRRLTRTNDALFNGISLGLRMRFERARRASEAQTDPLDDVSPTVVSTHGRRILWRKQLSASDCQRQPGHGTGGVRLVQAGFVDPATGDRIDKTTYFRMLFRQFNWQVVRQSPRVEEATVAFHVVLRGQDFGVRNLVVSHKPSGEAGQANYTTILRWTQMTSEVFELNLTNRTLDLYEPETANAPYLLIVD